MENENKATEAVPETSKSTEVKAEDIAEFKRTNIWERFLYTNEQGQPAFNLKGAMLELDKRARLSEEALGYLATYFKELEEKKQGPKIIGLNNNKIITP